MKEDKKILKLSCDCSDDFGREFRGKYNFYESLRNRDPYKFVYWGERNDMPYNLYDMYLTCGTLQSLVDSATRYIIGDGIDYNPKIIDIVEQANISRDKLDDIIYNCVTDYNIFGGFSVQRVKNLSGEISELMFNDMRTFRISGNKKYGYINEIWSRNTRTSYRLPLYGYSQESPVDIYYYAGEHVRGWYPIPCWLAHIKSVDILREIENFHYNTVKRNFSPAAIINVNNGVPSDEEQEEFEEGLKNLYTGTDNASKLVVTYNEDKDHGITIERLADDSFDTKFHSLLKTTRENVYSSFQMSPVLAGIMTETTGFSQQEFIESFELYNNSVAMPRQKIIEGCFDEIFSIKDAIKFKPMTVEKATFSNIPTSILDDLTQDERRTLVGFEPINDTASNESILAERLGVGGADSLISVITNTELTYKQKLGALTVLFGLSNEDAIKIIGGD